VSWTLGDCYHLLCEQARRYGYVVKISSVPQVGVGHWDICFCVASEDDVWDHPDKSLRKDFKDFPLDEEGVRTALVWLSQWEVRRGVVY
jgi:hypothetical protein